MNNQKERIEGVHVVDTMPMPDGSFKETTAEKLEVKPVDYKSLTKEQLEKIVESKDVVINNYEHKMEEITATHKQEIDNMNNYYKQRLTESNSLVGYYERKMKILKDIITIETGGEKDA